MEKLFLAVLHMSLTASYVILCIMLVRLPLKKAPKIISYVLWSIAAFRLICPVSFESIFSLIPTGDVPISQKIVYQQNSTIGNGAAVSGLHNTGSLPFPSVPTIADPTQIYIKIGAYVWIFGIVVMLVYSIVSVAILKKCLKSARNTVRNIYEADNLKTPFVLGVIRPKIYIPVELTADEKSYIIRHEQTHIRRCDHIVKPFAFLLLSIHWFNPLVWLAFHLMSTDMELSCDERVIKEMGGEIKKAYSESLLSLATGKHIINGSPLAFGEGNVQGRIKNVLNYKKPAFWIVTVAVISAVCIGIGLTTNPKVKTANESSHVKNLYQYRTQYVGDNGKVINILDNLPISTKLTRTQVQLFTDKAPYSVEATYKTTAEMRGIFSKAEKQGVFDESAVLMLSLIGNADSVKFILNDGTQDLVIQRDRAWANQVMAGNVWDGSSTLEKFTVLYTKVMKSSADIDKSTSSKSSQLAYPEVKRELSLIPKNYTVQNAVAGGCFVIANGKIKSNAKIAEDFFADSRNGKKTSIKIVQYTTEGDPIITKAMYNGSVYYGAEDDSRDAYSGGYFEFEYPYLKIFQSSLGQYVYLVKDERLTLEKIQRSYLSSKSTDWIDCRLLFVLPNVRNQNESTQHDRLSEQVAFQFFSKSLKIPDFPLENRKPDFS